MEEEFQSSLVICCVFIRGRQFEHILGACHVMLCCETLPVLPWSALDCLRAADFVFVRQTGRKHLTRNPDAGDETAESPAVFNPHTRTLFVGTLHPSTQDYTPAHNEREAYPLRPKFPPK